MNLIEELEWRGLLKNKSDGLEEALAKGPITGYIGYDPTAGSLTIGNLVTLMLLKHLQRHGHRPIVLMGGATGKIGDPSGKDAERQLLTYDVINQNIERFKNQVRHLLDFEGKNAAKILNNADFYDGMDVFTFLRDIGKNITVNYMMAKDSVKNRIEDREQGLSFTEFSYQLIQGYDFQHLYEHEGCTLQMGGSDQWGNITTGTHFIGKAGGKGYGLTCPLLTKADGSKIGKSVGGTVWLAADMTSPYKFYQYWLNNVMDVDILKMFKTFSLRSKEEIEALMEEHLETNPNHLKQLLAEELTVRIHSQEAYESAKRASQIVFNKKLKADFLHELAIEEWQMLQEEMPSFYIDAFLLEQGLQADDLLVQSDNSLPSKGKIRTAIKGNALSINAEKVGSHEQMIQTSDLLQGQFLFVQNGKKNKFIGVLTELSEEAAQALKAVETQLSVEEPSPILITEATPLQQELLNKGYLVDQKGGLQLSPKGQLFCSRKFATA